MRRSQEIAPHSLQPSPLPASGAREPPRGLPEQIAAEGLVGFNLGERRAHPR
jgi:hypothetical protein